MGEERSAPAGLVAGLIGGLVALAVLAIQLPADPATGVTFSNGPFTDEGWSTLGGRNQALLGRWSTDEMVLFWAQLPFNALVLVIFELFGVGIIQARIVSVVATAAAVAIVAALVARRLGEATGIVVGVAMATSGLLVYYGRLAFLEPTITVCLVAGTALLLRYRGGTIVGGVLAGAALALAIGTKPSAGVAVAGILLGATVASRFSLGRRAAVAAGTIAAAGGVWAAVVLSQPGLLETLLKIWPVIEWPGSVSEAIERSFAYLESSDRALGFAAPLVIGSVLGAVVALVQWRNLDRGQRALAGAAFGWLALGMGVLLVASYRPSRYVVPMVPAMALLTGFAVSAILDLVRRRVPGPRRALVSAAALTLIAVLAFRGTAALGTWMAGATYELPRIQEEVLEIIADDPHAVEGAGPTFAMRAPVPLLVTRLEVNQGDLYELHGVRWLLMGRDDEPVWVDEHPEAWAAREVLTCYPWPSGEACLIRVP